jgi:2-C-methyl-D-erythritol 4-phosphate cytidylyltransferase
MRHSMPKQYLLLHGRCVIEHTLDTLVNHPRISGLVVVIGAEDGYWQDTAFAGHPRVLTAPGGSERADSVRNGLDHLAGRAAETDWVLVHDAARPCLLPEDLDRLMEQLQTDPVGGVLGQRVRDTMKQADAGCRVTATVDRSGLWHAFTPQMFRLGLLRRALDAAARDGVAVTDEASAVEHLGMQPQMVEGHAGNIKITQPEDLTLAGFYLQQAGHH